MTDYERYTVYGIIDNEQELDSEIDEYGHADDM